MLEIGGSLAKITYIGNLGAEQIEDGVFSREPGALDDSHLISNVLNYLQSRVNISGIFFEYKEISASIHYQYSINRKSAYEEPSVAIREAPDVKDIDVFWVGISLRYDQDLDFTKVTPYES